MGHFKITRPMTRQLTLMIFVLTICLTSCGKSKTDTLNKEQQQSFYTADTSLLQFFHLTQLNIGYLKTVNQLT